MRLRILLVDDHEIVRRRIKTALEGEKGIEVVGEAEDGLSAVALTRNLQPDVVLMDVMMPVMNGIEATRWILAELPTMRVIGWSVHTDRRYVKGMLEAGALGYLAKTCSFEELVRVINTVCSCKASSGSAP